VPVSELERRQESSKRIYKKRAGEGGVTAH